MKANRIAPLFLLPLLASPLLSAADFSWSGASPLGGGNNNMSNPANWSGPNAPPNTGGTADLIFSGIARTTPNANVDYLINTIRFTSTQRFTLGGNSITLQTDAGTDPLIRNESAAADRINNPFTFNNSGTIHAQNGNLTFGGLFGTGANSASPNTINIETNPGHTINFIGNIGGFGGFTKSGTGILRITGNAFNIGPFVSDSGTTVLSGSTLWSSITINSGIIRLEADNRIPTVPVTLNSSSANTTTLLLDGFTDTIGPISGNGSIFLGDGGKLTVVQNIDTTFTGLITGFDPGSSFTKAGTGNLTVRRLIHEGPTNVTGGTLTSSQNFSFSEASFHTISSGATLATGGHTERIGGLAGAGTLNLSSGLLDLQQDTDALFSGNILGLGTLQKFGAGTLHLTSNSPAYHGNTILRGGRIILDAPNALRNISLQGGCTVEIGKNISPGSGTNLTISGTGLGGIGALRLNAETANSSSTINGNITLNGNSTITLDRTAAFTSALTLGNTTTPGTIALSTHTLSFNGNSPAPSTINHSLTGSGGITLATARNLILNSANPSFSGPINIQQGTLILNHPQALGTGNSPITIAANSGLRLSNSSTAININSNRVINLADDFFTDTSSSWSGSGNIQINPGAELRVSGSGSTFTIGGTGQITGNAELGIFAASSNSIEISRNINLGNAHGIRKTGGGILLLNGAANYTGITEIAAGTVRLGTTGAIPSASRVSLTGTGTLDLNNLPTQTAGVSGSGNVILGTATLSLSPTANLLHSGNISGSGGIEILGNGTHSQAFTTANTFTGPTIVRNNGRLVLASATGNPLSTTAPLTLEANGTIAINTPNTVIGGLLGSGHIEFPTSGNLLSALTISTTLNLSNFRGSSSGLGRIIKDGANDTLFLVGATLLHSGETRVKRGTINKNAATTMPNTHVFVEAAGTFSGFGAFKSFEIDGGTINPGLTTDNNVQLTTTETSFFRAGARYEWKIGDWDGTGGNGHNLIAPQALQLTTTAAAPLLIRVNAPANLANLTESPRVFKIIRSETPITGNDLTAIAVEYSNNAAGLTGTWSARIAGNDLELVYTPTGGDTYESWIATYDVGTETAMGDDPDGDGIPNGIEYVIGGNPQNENDSDKLPTIADDADHFLYTYRRATRSIYLNPRVQHSTTLQNPWTTATHNEAGVTIAIAPLETDIELITVRIPKNSDPKKFARLLVGTADD